MSSGDGTLFDLDDDSSLRLPSREELNDALAALPPESRPRFQNELIDALYSVEEQHSLDPLRSVIKAWYRSALFFKQPGFPERLRQAAEDARSLIGR